MIAGDEWWRPIPHAGAPGTPSDPRGPRRRSFADGFVALLLPIYLLERGFSAFAIGSIITSTLVGSALLTLWVGMIANQHPRRRMLSRPVC